MYAKCCNDNSLCLLPCQHTSRTQPADGREQTTPLFILPCNLHQPGARHCCCRCQLLLRASFLGWVCLLPGPSLPESPSLINRDHHYFNEHDDSSLPSLNGKWPVLPPIAALVLVVQRLQRLHHLHSTPAIFESVTNRRRQHHNTPKHLSHSTAPAVNMYMLQAPQQAVRNSRSPAPNKLKSPHVKSKEP